MKQVVTLFLLLLIVAFVNAQNSQVVKIKTSPTLGEYLTDKDGKTLYFFSNDADGKNHCSGGCVTA